MIFIGYDFNDFYRISSFPVGISLISSISLISLPVGMTHSASSLGPYSWVRSIQKYPCPRLTACSDPKGLPSLWEYFKLSGRIMPWQWPRFVAVPAFRVYSRLSTSLCLCHRGGRYPTLVACDDVGYFIAERVSRGAWAPQFEVPAALRGFAIYDLVFLGPKIAS